MLSRRVKYIRLVRRKINGRNRFYTQLVCEGTPYRKPENRLDEGIVGLDIGPPTVARVSGAEARLDRFCAERWTRRRKYAGSTTPGGPVTWKPITPTGR